jgi:hypothetical protein
MSSGHFMQAIDLGGDPVDRYRRGTVGFMSHTRAPRSPTWNWAILVEVAFASTQLAINGLSVGDSFCQDNSGAWESHYIFDRNGGRPRRSGTTTPRLRVEQERSGLLFRHHLSNDLMWEKVDQTTGVITAERTPTGFLHRPADHGLGRRRNVMLAAATSTTRTP